MYRNLVDYPYHLQQQIIQQLQMQLYGQTSPWNVGVAYRIPDTNFNLQGSYQQGRTNLQLSCVPDEGIFLALMALLSRGDEVIVTVPAYASLFEICHAQGCSLVPWLPVERSEAEGELWDAGDHSRSAS